MLSYVVAIISATRDHPQIQVGASPRGGLALVQLARGQALLRMREFVTPDDIKSVAVAALAHRITLRPELWVRQVRSDEVIARLLAAGCVAWSALPVQHSAELFSRPVLVAAAGCAVLGTARLAVGAEHSYPARYRSVPERTGLALLAALRAIPWADGMVLAVLVLEAMHSARPYHTGLLAAALVGYLFATHLAETGARPGTARQQLPLIAAGLGLLVIATGAVLLPVPAGQASGWLSALAVIAAILAGALALPV